MMLDGPKNSFQTVKGRDMRIAHVILYAISRSTVLFSTFKLSNFHLILNRIPALNSRAVESKELCALTWTNV